jgi:hypothetical protein
VWLRGRDGLINTDHLGMLFAEVERSSWLVAGRMAAGERGGMVVVVAEAQDEAEASSLLDHCAPVARCSIDT